jgi:elongation factor 2
MIIKHLPSPVEAQKYKIPKIRRGDINSEVGKAMLNVDPDGPLVGMITKILIHPKSKRPILIGRIFSGTLEQGQEIKLITSKSVARVQRLGTLVITDMLDIDKMPAGNLFATMGFVATAGESFSDPNLDIPPFEEIKYASEPVVSVSIYPKDPKDIAKLGEDVRIRVLADPTLRFYYDQESQTYILSGIDPLQLEIVIKRINEIVSVKVEPPIIVYREKPEARGQEFHTKSLNALNRIKIYVEPMPEELSKAIREGIITDDMDPKQRAEILRTRFGRDSRLARNIVKIEGTNILVNATVGIQRLDRIMDSIEGAFVEFVHGGPLAKEPVMDMIAYITDATVHEDPAHTGRAQIVPMVSAALTLSFITAQPKLYEPILRLDIKTPMKYLGAIQTIIGKRRGQVMEIEQEDEDTMRVIALVPAAETLDLANEIRSATQGRAFYGYEFYGFAPVPQRLQEELIKKIRERKGLPPEPPKIEDFQRFIYVRQD